MIHTLKNWGTLTVVVVGFSSFGTVQAQGPAISQPINNWSYINHSSTALEGALRGQSAVISSAGQATYMDSLASINYAEAYKRAIENSVAVTKAYYERRELREEFLKKYGPKPFAGEARRRAIEYYQPKKMSAQEFNPQLQQVNWPHVLRQDQFAAIVKELDTVFASRNSNNSGDGSTTQRQAAQLCSALDGILRENIENVTPDQYISTKEFIRSVDLEAKTAVQPTLIAKPTIVNEVNEVGATTPVNATTPATESKPEPASAVEKTDSDTTAINLTRTRVTT